MKGGKRMQSFTNIPNKLTTFKDIQYQIKEIMKKILNS